MKQIFLPLLFLMVFFSCSNSNDISSRKQIRINFEEDYRDLFKTSQLIDSTYYIVLDSSFLLGKVDEIKVVNGLFYCVDKHNGTISKFDKTGKFVGSFKRSGHSKSEYIRMSDADISQDGGIHVYDEASRRILKYSCSGDYIGAFEFDNIARDFAVLGNGDYLFYTPDYQFGAHSGLWKTDSTGEFKKQLISVDEGYKYGVIHPSYIKKYDHNLYGLMSGEDKDNIYMISQDTVINACHINFNMEIPRQVQCEMNFDINKYKGLIYTKIFYIESNRWLFFTCTNFETTISCYYDKKNDVCYRLTNLENYVDDVEFIGISGSDCVFNGRYWLTLLEPLTIKNSESLSKLFPNVKENSNPIIRIAKLSD